MIYANGVRVNHKLWGGPKDGNAVQFIGTEGRIEVSREFLRTFPNESLAKAELKPTDKRVYFSDNHYQDWVDAMKKRSKPISDVEIGHRTASFATSPTSPTNCNARYCGIRKQKNSPATTGQT